MRYLACCLVVMFVGCMGDTIEESKTKIETVVDSIPVDKLSIPVVVSSKDVPELSDEIILAIVEELKEVEKNNGYTSIARKFNVSPRQVKVIHKEMLKKLNSAK